MSAADRAGSVAPRCASSSPARRARSARISRSGCCEDGHQVFGIDKRLNTWTDAFPYLLQDLAGHYAPYPGGINGVEYPEADLVVHLAAHAKVHQLVREPHRALENAMMTFNVLEYARQGNIPIVFSSSREVYGDVHRFEGYNEQAADFAYTESTYSASKIAGEAFIYSYARCYGLPYLVFRFSNVYGRYDNDLQRMVRVIPLFIHSMLRGEPITIYGGRDKTLDFTYVDDCVDGIARGIEALAERPRRQPDDQPRVRPGQHARPLRGADRGRARTSSRDMTLAPSLLGEVTHYVADLSKARELLGYDPEVPLDDGHRARGRAGSASTATRIPRRTSPSAPTTRARSAPAPAGRRRSRRRGR